MIDCRTNVLIETPGTSYSSPSRKARKQVNYAESDAEEDEDEVFKPLSGNGRASKRRKVSVKDESDDEFGFDAATQAAMESDDGMHNFHYCEDLLTSLLQSSMAFNKRRGCHCRNKRRKLTNKNQIWKTLSLQTT